MNIMGQGAMGQKARQVRPDRAYMGFVKQMPCIICGAPAPSDAHHCCHRPLADEPHGYTREPCAGRRSGDRDTIPLCKACHQDGPNAIHNNKTLWWERHGPDYGYIPVVRAAFAAMNDELDF